MTNDAPRPPDEDAAPQFDVVTDGGLDAFESLHNDVPAVPFGLHFGPESFTGNELPREQLFARLRGGGPHPSTSQPTPEQYAEVYRAAERPLLVVTISAALSGSLNAADQARSVVPDADVTLHDARTLSAAQAFQVHAAMTARERGHDVATAVDWMRRVHEETELYFTIDTLVYLQRGGRIGRVQATLGGLLNLKPVVTVDKATAAYTTAGRARTWPKALDAIAQQVSRRFGADTPVRAGVVYGEDRADADGLLEQLSARHPVTWSDTAPVGTALVIHTGPKAVGLAVAPERWPWEGDGA